MDLKRLQFLREVAARGTISAAAEALGYTPSAVSQQLSVFETEMGTPLLERQGRNVILTPAGEALVRASADVFAAVDRAEAAVEQAGELAVGPVRIGSFQSIGSTIVPRAFTALHRKRPALEAHFVQYEYHLMRDLDLGVIDIALGQQYSNVPKRDEGRFDRRDVLVEPVFLAVPSDSNVRTLRDAADEMWVVAPTTTDCGKNVRNLCADAGFDPDVRFHSDDNEVTLSVVAAGLGVGILPRLGVIRPPEGVRLILLRGATRTVYVNTRPGTMERPAIAAVITELLAAGEEVAAHQRALALAG
ncbi:MAG TPA: LysR family transcriptional regulator [Acidimicrobiia bacterium]|nr:LysR family transcriptional regulator [Acidimicrobiia bacterium]